MRKLAILAFALALLVTAARVFPQPSVKGAVPPAPRPVAATATSPSNATASRQAAPGLQQVELSESEVNQLLRDGLSSRGYPVDDLTVRLEEGRFVATSTQQVSFLRLPVTVVGEAGVVDGQLSVRPLSVTAAGAAIPQSVVDQMADQVRTQLAAELDNLPLRLVSIQIMPGKLVVQGMPK